MPKIVGVHAPDFTTPVGKTQFMKIYITENSLGTYATGVWHNTAQAAIDYKDPYGYEEMPQWVYGYEEMPQWIFIILEVDQAQ